MALVTNTQHYYSVTTAPTVEPITLAQAKSHLRVDISDDDTLISTYISAARAWAEEYTRSYFAQQSVRLSIDALPYGGIYLRGPVQSVSSIQYYDTNSAQQTLATGLYVVEPVSGRVERQWDEAWPVTEDRPGCVTVDYVAGYAEGSGSPTDYAENVPAAIKAALLLIVGNLYENREANVVGQEINSLPMGVESLLQPYRNLRF